MNLSLTELLEVLRKAGVERLVAKPLAENDNTKQQIYLGGSFKAISMLPFNEIVADKTAKCPNFKAKLSLHWINSYGNFEPAPHAQLILYPAFPEVRLSGFLMGCKCAPSALMQPVPKENRRPKNSWDGRVLFFGIRRDGDILAILSAEGSPASLDFDELKQAGKLDRHGVLYAFPAEKLATSPLPAIELPDGMFSPATRFTDTRHSLLGKLGYIRQKDWVQSVRLYASGEMRAYQASNGGGYTLEAHLDIVPNGRSEPDFLGWEIKAHSSTRVTLMTPEPDAGYYGEQGAEAFLRRYGYLRPDDTLYFTGVHRIGIRHPKTGQMIALEGFDATKGKIVNVDGGITMIDRSGNVSAAWTYPDLIAHWARKHANAAYVSYESRETEAGIEYRYLSPAMLGTGTDFSLFLLAMHAGTVVYDPAPKLTGASTDRSRVKARSQFRISVRNLACLYEHMELADF